MPTVTKKSTTKASSKAVGAASKSHAATHPSWIDMIKECIASHPEDARTGVSRPTIKKFVESKYHIELNATAASQLNRAITSGSDKGIFNLPKGPSGKVKLAPKAKSDAAKEARHTVPPLVLVLTVAPFLQNTKPVVKKPASAKAPASKGKATATKPAAVKKAPAATKAKADSTKAKSTTASTKKPAAATKKTPATAKAAAKPKKAASATAKKPSSKKGTVKKAVTGEAKKPVSKPKAKAPASGTTKAKPTSTKAKPASKAKAAPAKKPASTKAKPASKAKPTSKAEAPAAAA
ncbi:hypothetical protein FA13DRAFT_1752783 [Coprinellus micaceus]|uniref:Histone H1 n=1 Tax=Coprinellus micaceus TaxID=71717 RepID=A0A4Y7TPI8_COPMI|nr:hypothetical protein FA13DRAFT_1752783 [Coprinellus micaceus]